ncbi:MAG: hypothetical protein M1296_03180 [Chloroflexi bacterium]|nr:hypothetical protein [Chloroflexota bacterium]
MREVSALPAEQSEEQHLTSEKPSGRKRDTAVRFLLRRPTPVIVARAPQTDLNAESYARAVGAWGTVSGDIGQRWENLGSGILREIIASGSEHLGRPQARSLILLDSDPEVHRQVERAGVSCPDAVLLRVDQGTTIVAQAVDFKVSLDTASYDQIATPTLARLIDNGLPRVRALLEAALSPLSAALPGGASDEPIAGVGLLADGVFVAPDTAFNRAHLRSKANTARKRPLQNTDVFLLSTKPQSYVDGLPGWREAEQLLAADRASVSGERDLGLAERYLRLGSGVCGALNLLSTPLFDGEPDQASPMALTEFLRGFASSVEVVEALRPQREARMELFRRRDRIYHSLLSKHEVQVLLGLTQPRGERFPPALWSVLLEALEELRGFHRERVSTRGRELLRAGLTDAAVLDQLERERFRFLRAQQNDVLVHRDRWWARFSPGLMD